MKKILIPLTILILFITNASPLLSADPAAVNLKVAFIGDSGAGDNFQAVLNLIKNENAQIVMHLGDFDYDDGPEKWKQMVDSTLGTGFPYLGADGNHDNWDSDGYAAYFKNKLSQIGLTPPSGNLPSSYAFAWQGLKFVVAKEDGDPSFIESQLAADNHQWKICAWHKNQTYMQLGNKSNEQGWPDYETCRKYGAIIATAHEHSYQRTKTLTSMENLTVDSSAHPLLNGIPQNQNSLLVAPGKSFVFVSGLGGASIRNQDRCPPAAYPYGGGSGCNYIWANVYTSDQQAKYGALFITFNAGGIQNKATGYFKNIAGQITDQFTVINSQAPPPTVSAGVTLSLQPSGGILPGDANKDGKVDGVDYVIWLNNYNKSVNNGSVSGDFNLNGKVDGVDYVIWLNNYNQ